MAASMVDDIKPAEPITIIGILKNCTIAEPTGEPVQVKVNPSAPAYLQGMISEESTEARQGCQDDWNTLEARRNPPNYRWLGVEAMNNLWPQPANTRA